jgi:hypothetical protein
MVSHPYLPTVLTIIGTLVGKYLWDRFLSTNSRVTVPMCDLIRKNCKDQIMSMVNDHDAQLDCGEHSFKDMSSAIMVIMITLLKICEKQSIDCEDIHKVMIKKGLMD